VASNPLYVQLIHQGLPANEYETLTPVQQLNERIMTALRLSTGLAVNEAQQQIGGMATDAKKMALLVAKADHFVDKGLMIRTGNGYVLTRSGKLFADGIAADLFID
jgi:oxygen-independent coproporphyrinogen-3 oxidase